jgi:hypothetical protein
MGGMLLRLLPLVVLVACSDAGPSFPKATAAERADAAQSALAKIPPLRSYHYDRGELLVFDVPVPITRTITGTQTCILWRDAELKTATMQCPVDTPDPPMRSAQDSSRF